jgi:hypothetical protein
MISDSWPGPRPDGSFGVGAGGGTLGPLSPLAVTVFFSEGDEIRCTFHEE